MKTKSVWLVFFAVLSLSLPALAAVPAMATVTGAQERDEFQWQGRLSPNQALEVRSVNGDVTVQLAPGAEAQVRAVKTGRNIDMVEIEVKEDAGGVSIRAIYPRRNRDVNARVDFTVLVPSGVQFAGGTVNGSVDVRSLDSDVEASTVNGDIEISTSGYAEAHTVNGSITASLGRSDWDGSLAFRTVNGSITVDLPSDVETEIRVNTVNGSISTDFPITIRGRVNKRHLNGVIGRGGRTLSFDTVNGSVRLRRAST